MFLETVRIVVVIGNRKLNKIVDITSDGSYHSVDAAVAKIVRKELAGHKVDKFYWNYHER
jgi:hypothetical protein